jgi:divalent metal cation (Fe/Co/Zn/Cd) transporter
MALTPERGETLRRRALLLSWFTVIYNILEGIVSILLGIAAGSIALVGFGLDSFVESLSGGIMIWRFGHRDLPAAEEERRERKATRLVGWTFIVLGAYVFHEALEKLLSREEPEASPWGLALLIFSLMIMPGLAWAKRRLGEALGSASLIADSRETLACAWLSATLIVGLSLNWLLGWWWADPVGALIVVWFLLREGRELISGEGCGCGGEDAD